MCSATETVTRIQKVLADQYRLGKGLESCWLKGHNMSKSGGCWIFVVGILAGCATVEPPPASKYSSPTPTIATTPDTSATQSQPVQQNATPLVQASKQRTTGTPDDARRHMIRGMAAIEMAKSPGELMAAEDEFRMATEIDDHLSNAWFNLAKVQSQLDKYQDAMDSYRHYLDVAPGAADSQSVQNEIIKLEFRQEQMNKIASRVGTWVGLDGTFYHLTVDGNHMSLKTDSRHVLPDEVSASYSLVGDIPTRAVTPAEFQLTFQGDKLSGSWTRAPVKADKCTVPADSASVTGNLFPQDKKMILRHEKGSFHASIQMGLLSDDSCAEVTSNGRKTVDEALYGPLGKGGPDFGLKGLYEWWEGGFSMIHFGWQGRLAASVEPQTRAYTAGLRTDDEILSIDGVAVKTLSAGETVMRLYGEPGSNMSLEVWRKGAKEPFVIKITRMARKES